MNKPELIEWFHLHKAKWPHSSTPVQATRRGEYELPDYWEWALLHGTAQSAAQYVCVCRIQNVLQVLTLSEVHRG